MFGFKGQKILIGISGGISAYKTLSLIRLLVKDGAEVKVVATPNALKFLTPLSIETLSQNKLYTDCFASPENYHLSHIALTEWADLCVVAPASANCIGKLANGIADNALSTTLLAYKKALFIAPAMNTNMYWHPAVQNNLSLLKNRGVHILEPEKGLLACGVNGVGKMQDPESILETIQQYVVSTTDFKGKRVLVSAGPTQEAIDPVRYITNHSTGLMGYALAEEIAQRGALVNLVSGPVHLQTKHHHIQVTNVISAQEMAEKCFQYAENSDIIIMTAAVADYTPKDVADHKIKKTASDLVLPLKKTTDIIAELGKRKKPHQILVGFALETTNELANAKHKLEQKNLDFIVLNSLNDKGAGFKTLTNKIRIIDSEHCIESDLKSKPEIAKDIVDYLCSIISRK